MDASLRWHDEEEAEDASLKVNCACTRETALGCRPLLRIRAPAALVHPEHRWHDGSTAAVKQSSFQRRLESIVR